MYFINVPVRISVTKLHCSHSGIFGLILIIIPLNLVGIMIKLYMCTYHSLVKQSSIGGDGTSAFLQFQDFFRWVFDDLNFRAAFFYHYEILEQLLTVGVPRQFYHSQIFRLIGLDLRSFPSSCVNVHLAESFCRYVLIRKIFSSKLY